VDQVVKADRKGSLKARVRHADGSYTDYGYVVGGGLRGVCDRIRVRVRGLTMGGTNGK
jgi:hypothetical protein